MLEHYGAFAAEEDLSCPECEGATKTERGCGVEPIVDGKPWIAGESRDKDYEFSVWANPKPHGFTWPCCPRYFLEFASDAARLEALRVLKLVRAADDQILASQYAGPMTTREVELYRIAKHFDFEQLKESHGLNKNKPIEFEPDPECGLTIREQLEAMRRASSGRGPSANR